MSPASCAYLRFAVGASRVVGVERNRVTEFEHRAKLDSRVSLPTYFGHSSLPKSVAIRLCSQREGGSSELLVCDELPDKLGGGVDLDRVGSRELLDSAAIEDCHAVGERERFFLVVSHEHRGDSELLVD